MIDKKLLEEHNLSEEEYTKIKDILGREPNLVELGLFSVMWSEHCSYKSSRIHLAKLPTKGKYLIQGPGENAGVVEADGKAVVFKVESHNHPSFVEPYQGAATGVGGILRDVFTMGARPVALLDSLHFGPLSKPANRAIMEGVVSGIAGYGNPVGVPTVGGEVDFEEEFSHNPLVNVMCVGLAERDRIFYARAGEPGLSLIYAGAPTGRDGIHGATMASAEFGAETEHKKVNVQVGDPFREKLLLEATLEVMEKDLIVGIQDMGAAGLTSSSSEMASKSEVGVELYLDNVPLREEGMTPYEILLSESQERMLMVAKKGKEDEIKSIFDKWGIDSKVVGKTTEDKRFRAIWKGKIVADIPVDSLAGDSPRYNRPYVIPEKDERLEDKWLENRDWGQVLKKILNSEHMASRHWVYEQYDHMVQINTVLLPGLGPAVLRIKGKTSGIALTIDANPAWGRSDPKKGAILTVAEAFRNLATVGAEPLGITNCLNFGNPEKPEIMGQFVETVEGMKEALEFFGVPVTGGNVSFYNETEGKAIPPTVTIGAVGLIPDLSVLPRPEKVKEGDWIYLLGWTKRDIGSSVYLKVIHNERGGKVPDINLENEKSLQGEIIRLVREGKVSFAFDLSPGGLLPNLSEALFSIGKGATLRVETDLEEVFYLFGESPSRAIIISPYRISAKVPVLKIGQIRGDELIVYLNGKKILQEPLNTIKKGWATYFNRLFDR